MIYPILEDYRTDEEPKVPIHIRIGTIDLFFSYGTLVAIRKGETLKVSATDDGAKWSNTTNKHLNLIDPDKYHRVPFLEFKAFKDMILSRFTESD